MRRAAETHKPIPAEGGYDCRGWAFTLVLSRFQSELKILWRSLVFLWMCSMYLSHCLLSSS